MRKKLICFALVALLTVSCLCGCSGTKRPVKGDSEPEETPTAFTELDSHEYIECGKTDDLRLSFQPSTTFFCVEDLKTGNKWYSNPQNVRDDQVSSRLIRMEMMSTLTVTYADIAAKKSSTVNTYTASVNTGNYTVELVNNGVRFNYLIPEIEAVIPLTVRLENGWLTAEVDMSSVKTNSEDIKIASVAVLPYFVTGSTSDEGYLFIPDGSGALVGFETKNNLAGEYSRPIYGEEPTNITADYYLKSRDISVYMPVYGARVNGSAIMAIAESAAESGILKAKACGGNSDFANVYINYSLLESVEYKVGNYSTKIYDRSGGSAEKISLRYRLLSGEDANYSGMARCYREYLKDSFGLEYRTVQETFYIDAYAGVSKTESVFGFKYENTVPLTTTGQAEEMILWLKENGAASVAMRYRSWNEAELTESKFGSADISSKLTDGLSFKEFVNSTKADIYPAVLTTHTYSGGGFIDHIINASYSMTNLPFSWKEYSVSTLNETESSFRRISLSKYGGRFSKLLNAFNKKEIVNIALGDTANSLYCDFKGEGYHRGEAKDIMCDALIQAAEQSRSVLLDSPNAYAVGYADVIYNAPLDHSNQDILDESVPFYTMALNGLVQCVSPSFNYNQVSDDIILYAAASGVAICYSWIYSDASELLNTKLGALSNVSYQTTRDQALKDYTELKEICQAVLDSKIYSHEYIDDGVSKTVYENKIAVYVNFNNSEKMLENGSVLPPKSFYVKAGDEN